MTQPFVSSRILLLLAATPALLAPTYASLDATPSGRASAEGFLACSARVLVDDPAVAEVEATLESDAGDEELLLVESDAWLHGTAAVSALPTAGADSLSLTLVDEAGATLATFSGTLSTGGAVSLALDSVKGQADPDIEVRGAELFAAASGYELALDLGGADTHDIAYAKLSSIPCDLSAERGVCAYDGKKAKGAEVAWDGLGSVWEAELDTCPSGEAELKVRSYDAVGKKRSTEKVKLAPPFVDADPGDGIVFSSVNALAVDDDPLTSVAVLRGRWDGDYAGGKTPSYWSGSLPILLVNSTGWTAGDSLPVDASVELADGTTLSIPVNSYARSSGGGVRVSGLGSYLTIKGGSLQLDGAAVSDMMDSPVCVPGGCMHLVDDGTGDLDLSVSVYDLDAAALPDELDLRVTVLDKSGATLESETYTLSFDDEITAVFATELRLTADPVGRDLTGKVSLLGEANSKGKQKTLAKGKVYGTVQRDGAGNLRLAGRDKGTSCGYDSDFVGGETNCVLSFKPGSALTITADPPPLAPVAHVAANGARGATFGVSSLSIYVRN